MGRQQRGTREVSVWEARKQEDPLGSWLSWGCIRFCDGGREDLLSACSVLGALHL